MIKSLRYVAEGVLLTLIFILSKCLPVSWASNFGGWIGRNIGSRLAASRKAVANISAAFPDKTSAEHHKIMAGMWDNLGRVMMEYPHLKTIATKRTVIMNGNSLKQYDDLPAIIFSAHFANWEVVPPALLKQHDITATAIYRAPNNPFSDWLLKRARTLKGEIPVIPKSAAGTRQIVSALKNNLTLGILIDQKYNAGMEADFFDRPAMTSPAFVQLAQKFNCPLIPLRIERLEGANFQITVHDPLDINDKPVEDVIADSHALLEGWISERPEQWLWLHRRWMNEPKGQK